MSFAKRALEKEQVDCKVPWLFDELSLSEKECNSTEYNLVHRSMDDVFNKMYGNAISECQRNCKEVKYESKMRFFKLMDGLADSYELEDIAGYQTIYMFLKSDVRVEELIPTLTFWGLISACGGSLGLFLGFSFYGLVSSALELLQNKA